MQLENNSDFHLNIFNCDYCTAVLIFNSLKETKVSMKAGFQPATLAFSATLLLSYLTATLNMTTIYFWLLNAIAKLVRTS